MKIKQVTNEANIAPQILKDPKMTKMLNIAFRHDSSLPMSQISRLGPRPTDKQIVELWADMLERSLADTIYGNLARLNKFEPWLLKLYINGVVDYEGINGEGGDTLGAWNALSVRGLLKPQHQDFNKFQSIDQLTRALRDYSEILAKIKDQAALEKHKRDRREIVLIDNERFYVAIPLNYGSCYTFNNAVGVQANFCTGGSSGLSWFKTYSVDGPIIIVFDKANPDKDHGKWQMHTATDQLVDAKQTMRYNLPYNAKRFTSLFPGLLEEIMSAISARAEEIHEASKAIVKDGYDIGKEIARLSIVNSHKEDQPGGTVAEGQDAEKLYQQNLIREIHDRLVEMRAGSARQNKGVAEGSLNEFAPGKGGGNDYLRELASAWYNGIFNTGSLHKGIKSQEDVERVLARGIISADGKTRRYNIDYSPNFDGVVIYSDDYYEHGEAGGKIDNRTGKPWGPYDYIEFAGDELNESVSEGEVIKGRFGQKFVPTLGRTVRTSRYERNPDIDIPMYDPVKHRVWHAGISELDNREPFDHFEVKASDIGVTTHIIGVAKDGRRISVSTTSSEELAQALVDAYNRGGFTDKDIEKVPLKESAKIRLSTDPDYFGAEVGDYRATGPIQNIMLNKLEGFEPDSKMEDPKSRANVEKIVDGIRRGDDIPPILVRKYHDGYQVLDGHHRFHAYKLLKKNSIPAQIVPAKDIEEVSKKVQGKKNES